MNPKLQEAYNAFQRADAAGNVEDAQQLADYIRELQNQEMLGSGDEGMMRNPMAAGAVGAVAGPVAGKVLETAYGPKGVPTVTPGAAPSMAGAPGQKYAAKTGYGAGTGETVREVVEEFKKQEGPLGKGKVTSKITGGALGGPAAMEQIAAKEADAARFAQMRAANQMAAQKASSVPGRIAQATAGRMPLLLKSAAGAGAGMQGADAYNRGAEGDYLGAGIGAIGAAGSAASLIPHPITRIGGTAIGLGAGALNTYIDYLKSKSQPQQPAAQPQPMAMGGLVNMAAGKLVGAGKSVAAKMSPGMSFGKASDETAQPSGRLVSSLANKFGYDEAKLAQDYPQTLFPILEKDKRTGNLFAGKATHPEAEAIKKARMFAQKEIAKGDYAPYFDITKRAYVDPAQYPLSGNTLSDAIPKTPDTIAKYEAIAKNPDALAQWQKGFDTGSQRPLAKDWYAMKQLQDEYVRVLGPKEGIKQFKARFADAMGATTGGADPTSNLMTAAYTNVMRQRGMDIPTEGFDVPYPVYGRFLGQNLEQAKKLHETGGLSAATQPKRHNFSGNFLGHRDLSTLDEQMMSAYLDPKTGSAYTSPPGGAYGLFQRELNNLADKNQVMPANFQDVTWAGLKDYPGKPMIQEINELLHRTSRIGGMTQKEALENFIRADKPVYKKGGSTTPAWQRSEGKSPSGGLNALGRASYKRETGGELKAPQPEGGSRKKSFCARMGGMKKKLTSSETANDPDSRINKALRKWKC